MAAQPGSGEASAPGAGVEVPVPGTDDLDEGVHDPTDPWTEPQGDPWSQPASQSNQPNGASQPASGTTVPTSSTAGCGPGMPFGAGATMLPGLGSGGMQGMPGPGQSWQFWNTTTRYATRSSSTRDATSSTCTSSRSSSCTSSRSPSCTS